MYRRIRQADPLGLEPRKLFVVCDYMMNDTNGDGVVAMDEAVQLMFMRYGKSFRSTLNPQVICPLSFYSPRAVLPCKT